MISIGLLVQLIYLALFAGEQAERKNAATTRIDDGDMKQNDAKNCISNEK